MLMLGGDDLTEGVFSRAMLRAHPELTALTGSSDWVR